VNDDALLFCLIRQQCISAIFQQRLGNVLTKVIHDTFGKSLDGGGSGTCV